MARRRNEGEKKTERRAKKLLKACIVHRTDQKYRLLSNLFFLRTIFILNSGKMTGIVKGHESIIGNCEWE